MGRKEGGLPAPPTLARTVANPERTLFREWDDQVFLKGAAGDDAEGSSGDSSLTYSRSQK